VIGDGGLFKKNLLYPRLHPKLSLCIDVISAATVPRVLLLTLLDSYPGTRPPCCLPGEIILNEENMFQFIITPIHYFIVDASLQRFRL